MNPTGIRPVEYKVLILVDELKDQSAGGIYIPEHALEREQIAHDRGTLVDMSEMAFTDWIGRKPEIGTKVIFSKYAGAVIHFNENGGPRQRYRLCNDKDICAILEEEK
jgi:co-chaperonin GroES (HSP10)